MNGVYCSQCTWCATIICVVKHPVAVLHTATRGVSHGIMLCCKYLDPHAVGVCADVYAPLQ